jgi:hypothetical protein
VLIAPSGRSAAPARWGQRPRMPLLHGSFSARHRRRPVRERRSRNPPIEVTMSREGGLHQSDEHARTRPPKSVPLTVVPPNGPTCQPQRRGLVASHCLPRRDGGGGSVHLGPGGQCHINTGPPASLFVFLSVPCTHSPPPPTGRDAEPGDVHPTALQGCIFPSSLLSGSTFPSDRCSLSCREGTPPRLLANNRGFVPDSFGGVLCAEGPLFFGCGACAQEPRTPEQESLKPAHGSIYWRAGDEALVLLSGDRLERSRQVAWPSVRAVGCPLVCPHTLCGGPSRSLDVASSDCNIAWLPFSSLADAGRAQGQDSWATSQHHDLNSVLTANPPILAILVVTPGGLESATMLE